MNVLFIWPKRLLCSFPILYEWKQDLKTVSWFVLASDSDGSDIEPRQSKNTDDVRCRIMRVVTIHAYVLSCFRLLFVGLEKPAILVRIYIDK